MAFANGDFPVEIPEGYVVVETDRVIASDSINVFIHVLKYFAERHAKQLNEDRVGPLLRWEVERTPQALRDRVGIHFGRWAVVPYQNVLQREDDV